MKKFFDFIENASQSRLHTIILAVVILFVWGLMTHEKISGDGDEPHYMMICHSLAFDHDFDLSNNYGDKTNLIFGGNLGLEGAHASPGRNGRLYPDHDIGMPLLYTPYYYLSYRTSQFLAHHLPESLLNKAQLDGWGLLKYFLGLSMVFLTGLLAIQIFDLCFFLTQKKVASFLWAIFVTISPPLLSFSYLFFTEIVTALITFYVYKKLKMTPALTSKSIFFLGFLSGYLFLIHSRNIGILIPMIPIYIYSIIQKPEWKNKLFYYGTGLIVSIAFRNGMNFYFWSNILINKHLELGSNWNLHILETLKNLTLVLFALPFDQEGGLFIVAPIYLFAISGFRFCYLQSKDTFWELTVLVLFNFLLIVSFPLWNGHGWSGFWSPAGRFLVPVIPFLAVGTFYLFSNLKRIPILLKFFIFLQIGIDLFFWQHPKLLWNNGLGESAALKFLSSKNLNLVPFLPSWSHYSTKAFYFSLFLLGMTLGLNAGFLNGAGDGNRTHV